MDKNRNNPHDLSGCQILSSVRVDKCLPLRCLSLFYVRVIDEKTRVKSVVG